MRTINDESWNNNETINNCRAPADNGGDGGGSGKTLCEGWYRIDSPHDNLIVNNKNVI